MLISKTPLRISFFGGGTDYPAYCNNQSGYVFGSTIDYYIYILIKKLEFFDDYKYKLSYSRLEKKNNLNSINHKLIKNILQNFGYKNIPLEINVVSDVPAKTGLGSSSSFTVGLLNGLFKMDNNNISKRFLRNESINLEKKYSDKYIGYQDQTFATYGGFNLIKFDNLNFSIKKVTRQSSVKELEKNLLLIYIDTRSKKNLTKSLSKNIDNGVNRSYLKDLTIMAQESFKLFNSSTFNVKEFGHLLKESWKLKKLTNKEISNNKVETIISELINLGAYGAKLFGAGNSGFIGAICYIKTKKRIKQRFKDKCYEIKFTDAGSTIKNLSTI